MEGLNIVVLPYTPLFFIQGIYTRSVCNNINKVKMKEKTEKMEFVVFRLLRLIELISSYHQFVVFNPVIRFRLLTKYSLYGLYLTGSTLTTLILVRYESP